MNGVNLTNSEADALRGFLAGSLECYEAGELPELQAILAKLNITTNGK